MEQCKLLIVDDDLISVHLLDHVLKDLGYTVVGHASTGEEGIALAKKHLPEVVLMDINLPGEKDGIETSRELNNLIHTPVVYITSYEDQEVFQRALATNPSGYIVKPFDRHNLTCIIEMAIHRHRLETQLSESQHFLSTTLKNIADAVIATNMDRRIVMLNDTAEQLTKTNTNEVKNQPLETILQLQDQHNNMVLLDGYFSSVNPKHENLFLKCEEEIIPIDLTSSIIKDDEEKIFGYIFTFRDITLLKKAESDLKNMNRILEEKVKLRTQELFHKNKLLQTALAKEKELNDFREKIVTTISHEFKTPLTTISSSAELLARFLDRPDFAQKATRHLGIIDRSVDIINRLLKNVTKHRELETKNTCKPSLINTTEFYLKLADYFSGGFAKDHRLILENNTENVFISADKELLWEVCSNLISNAVKYSPKESLIIIRIETKDTKFICSVIDQGQGILPEEKEKLFDYFFRSKRNENTEGSGVGLNIVQRALELMNGKIVIDSVINEGSCFTFTIPIGEQKYENTKLSSKQEINNN